MKNKRQAACSVCAGSIDGLAGTIGPRPRRGTVVLVCVIVEAIISLLVLGILSSLQINAATMSAVGQHEQSLYLAESGVQHAVSVLAADPAWTGQLQWSDSDTAIKSKDVSRQYNVTVATDVDGNSIITSEGDFNGIKKSLQLMRTATAGNDPKEPNDPQDPKKPKKEK